MTINFSGGRVWPDALWQRRARPLPITAKPFAREMTLSYIHRLALVNQVSPMLLIQHLGDCHNPNYALIYSHELTLNAAAVARLAVFSGQPEAVLRAIAPDGAATNLGSEKPMRYWRKRPVRVARMCSRCAARRGVRQRVGIVLQPHQLPLCRRHCLVLDFYDSTNPQLSFAAVPEISDAANRYHILTRRRPADTLARAMRAAAWMIRGWRPYTDKVLNLRWSLRAELLGVNNIHPIVRLPETIALAQILSHLQWDVTELTTGEGIRPVITDGEAFLRRAARILDNPEIEGTVPAHRGNPFYRWLGPTPRHRQA